MLALWDAFKREGIQVPYPVRDIRVARRPAGRGRRGSHRLIQAPESCSSARNLDLR